MARAWAVCLLLAGMLGLSACNDPALDCTDPAGCVRVGADEPVIIATLLDNSGPAQELGAMVGRGVTMALAERENMALDHPVQVTEVDTGCRGAEGEANARSLVAQENVVGIIGTVCSQPAAAARPVLAEAGLIMISPANTAPSLTEEVAEDPPVYFRVVPSQQQQAKQMAAFAATVLEAETAVLFYDAAIYANDLRQTFAAAFAERGGRIVFQGQVASDLGDLDALVQTAAFYRPDVVYLALFEPEATPLLDQMRQSETLQDAALLGSDALLTESFARGAAPAVEGMYLTGTAVPPSEDYDAFRRRWSLRFGAPYPALGEWPAYAYDATALLLDAIDEVAQVSGDGAMLIGREALRRAVLETDAFPGLTGFLACNPQGDCAAPTIAVYRIPDVELSGWPPPVVWRP